MDKTKKPGQVESMPGGKHGDSNWWQRDFRKFAFGGLDNDIPMQPFLPPMPWAYSQNLWSHPLFQQLAHAAMPQSPMQEAELETSQEGQQGAMKPSPSDKAQEPQHSETSEPSLGAGHHPFHSMSADPNHDGPHSMGGTRAPYNHMGGFVYPAPYPGHWDPLTSWMHHVHRQAYLTSVAGCRNGYSHPFSGPSGGMSQRGYIKVPSGLPQKHSRLWEMQSTENMQLWSMITQLCATVARAETEICCQRGKISKLEDDLQTMKVHQEALLEALKNTTAAAAPQAKKGRGKRTATAPVAILGLPAIQLVPSRAPQFKRARGNIPETDLPKSTNELHLEDKSKNTHEDNNTPGSTQDGSKQIECSNRSESGTELSNKDCVGTLNAAYKWEHQNSLERSCPTGMPKESPLNIQIKRECAVGFSTDEVGMQHGAVSGDLQTKGNLVRTAEVSMTDNIIQEVAVPGDCSMESGLTTLSEREECVTENLLRKNDWLEGIGIDPAGNAIQGGKMYDGSSLERPNAISSNGKAYNPVFSNGANNQDLVLASEQEAGKSNGTTLDGSNGANASTAMQ